MGLGPGLDYTRKGGVNSDHELSYSDDSKHFDTHRLLHMTHGYWPNFNQLHMSVVISIILNSSIQYLYFIS